MVIGADVTIGENTLIRRSVIGDGCKIGAGVTISDSYMWAGSVVEDGAKLQGAVVASRAMAKNPAGKRLALWTGDRDARARRKIRGGVMHCWRRGLGAGFEVWYLFSFYIGTYVTYDFYAERQRPLLFLYVVFHSEILGKTTLFLVDRMCAAGYGATPTPFFHEGVCSSA